VRRFPLDHLHLPTVGQFLAGLSILGCAILLVVTGAAVMFFGLPTSGFLSNAFFGARAWHEREHNRRVIASQREASGDSKGNVRSMDRPDKTFDGFTLITSSQGCEARLIDMAGNLVHQWQMPFSIAWPKPPHIQRPFDDSRIHWDKCHLYPNGDLLAIYHCFGDTPYGYGLAKLNKDSKVLWVYSDFVHHDLDVGEDGRIYTLTQKFINRQGASSGLEFLNSPHPIIADELVILSAEGKELDRISIIEAYKKSPYALTLTSVKQKRMVDPTSLILGDFLHANAVRVLRQDRAAKFPLFKAGQVLTSFRNQDTIAVLDLPSRSVVWAVRSIWELQHDPEFLDNGHLLLFDNSGSPTGCRVIEYDPVTQAMPWSYSSENSSPFHAVFRGGKQRLPNGNTLIVDPDARRLLEVTYQKELVWELYCHDPEWVTDPIKGDVKITGAQRFAPKELTFLEERFRTRP
jgi:Arylsulfotransferase (ASST)